MAVGCGLQVLCETELAWVSRACRFGLLPPLAAAEPVHVQPPPSFAGLASFSPCCPLNLPPLSNPPLFIRRT